MKKFYPLTLVLLFLLFAGSFAIFFYILKGTIASQFDASAPDLLGLKNFSMLGGQDTKEKFENLGALAGLVLGIVPLLLSFLFWGLFSLFHAGKNVWVRSVLPFLSFGVMAVLGYELLFLEERTTILVRSIIYYIGTPLWYASLLTLFMILVLAFIALIQKHPAAKKLVLFIMLSVPFLSGCSLLSDLTAMSCSFGLDDTHCYQEAAIAGNDESTCDKVKPPEEFKKAGSNPPQDKCYMIVAENKKDPSICNKIKGGIGSYEKGDCIEEIAVGTQNYDLCTKGATSAEGCTQKIVDVEQAIFTTMMSAAEKEVTTNPATIAEMQIKLDRMGKMYDMMTTLQKSMYDMNMSAVRNLR
jgi:hypothetical protein